MKNGYQLRRVFQRWFGNGPWRMLPAAEIVAERTDELRGGVGLSESFAGLLGQVEYPAQRYVRGRPLLGAERVVQPSLGNGRSRYSLIAGLAPRLMVNVWTLQDAVVSGLDGVVYCPRSRTAVAETARRWLNAADTHPVLGAARRPPPRALQGIALHLISLDDGGFYHFLHESLARLWPARAWRSQADWYLVSGPRESRREDWLRAAGVAVDRVQWIEPLDSVRCEQLIFTDLPLRTCQPMAAHAAALRATFDVRETSASASQPNIWISRTDAGQRHFVWEDELLALLPDFKKVVLSHLTPAEQIAQFAGARAIVAPHGAGLANLAFAGPGGTLVEIFRPGDAWHPLYARLADSVGWRHAWACVDFERATEKAELVARIREFVGTASLRTLATTASTAPHA